MRKPGKKRHVITIELELTDVQVPDYLDRIYYAPQSMWRPVDKVDVVIKLDGKAIKWSKSSN